MRNTIDSRFTRPACAALGAAAILFSVPVLADESILFNGMCDASAAVALDPALFVVADDEENVLRIYRRTGGDPVAEVPLDDILSGGGRKSPEADLEGGAMIGDLIFWIGSHGLSAKGKAAPARQVFFATRLDRTSGGTHLQPVGRVYRHLILSFSQDRRLEDFHLQYAATLPPKGEDGLNIEGIAATPDGHLLIAFRNPVPRGKALLIPLVNPSEVTADSPARFGDPILLDLGGLGIRSIGYHRDRYLIIAGDIDRGRKSELFQWKGPGHAPARVGRVDLAGLNPEGISFQTKDGRTDYFVLSDDGRKTVAGQDCKNLSRPEEKHFRGRVIMVENED